MKDELVAHIQRLSEEDQLVLQLFYVEELDFNQIARALDCSLPKAIERLVTARTRLAPWTAD